ncbi:MAG: hypothetical protein NZM31_14975, partial [Gemmatales bacterium]|nr:hypothetical protein [Gemmatales bacterium]MDW8388299.1 hypothetical protein [Gemmatales bacterium]
DGKRVVTGSVDGTTCIWDAQTGQKLRTLQGHTSLVLSVSWSPDGKRVVTGSVDGTTRIWDAQTGKEVATLFSLEAGKNWLVVTPLGFVHGSPGGLKLVNWRKPGTLDLGPKEALLKRFHRPDLVAQALQPAEGR